MALLAVALAAWLGLCQGWAQDGPGFSLSAQAVDDPQSNLPFFDISQEVALFLETDGRTGEAITADQQAFANGREESRQLREPEG